METLILLLLLAFTEKKYIKISMCVNKNDTHNEDYIDHGRLLNECSGKLCKGRRYAILENGYEHEVIGLNTDSFCIGFD
jgi:hypothetical protein